MTEQPAVLIADLIPNHSLFLQSHLPTKTKRKETHTASTPITNEKAKTHISAAKMPSYTHSAGQSNVGARNIYGNDDQRNVSEAEVERVSRESGHNLKGHMADQHSTPPLPPSSWLEVLTF